MYADLINIFCDMQFSVEFEYVKFCLHFSVQTGDGPHHGPVKRSVQDDEDYYYGPLKRVSVSTRFCSFINAATQTDAEMHDAGTQTCSMKAQVKCFRQNTARRPTCLT
jgi:hypothetical protein